MTNGSTLVLRALWILETSTMGVVRFSLSTLVPQLPYRLNYVSTSSIFPDT